MSHNQGKFIGGIDFMLACLQNGTQSIYINEHLNTMQFCLVTSLLLKVFWLEFQHN